MSAASPPSGSCSRASPREARSRSTPACVSRVRWEASSRSPPPCPFSKGYPLAGAASPPLYLAHGYFDRIVPFALGHESKRLLAARGYEVEWRTYAIGHALVPRQLAHIAAWLERRVLAGDAAPVRAA